uniref:probable long-chain-alcohol O-fatty-acyltransferase 5 n=1 Tax=Erigeron canadensis TaxID=72917 RepID=UPI001CB9418A|nr:probable long-chain-alcohol O-fatty-acyltransferase 5 [Erigeron canadensis]
MMKEYNEELGALIKVWIVAILCISYCYLIPMRMIKKNAMSRLISLLPVITIFFILPLPFTTVHLSFVVFFYLTWLANFKLLLLAFNRGPLAPTPPLPFFVFVSVAMLPIDLKHSPNQKKKIDPAPAPVPAHKPFILAFKAIILNIIVDFYKYKHKLHPNVILALYKGHIFLTVELGLTITAFFLMIFLGFDLEIEPQFNEPLLATSLQDFWGRRWNLVSSRNLRAVVYNPTREILTPTFGKLRSQQLAICVTFLVSGLMHELLFLYITRVQPTWEVTWFFVLHGVCTAVEVGVKKTVAGRLGFMHRAVSWLLTVSFVMVTAVWLFWPLLLRNGVCDKVINEYSVMVNFVMSKCMGMKA